jgi:hypothetical protein
MAPTPPKHPKTPKKQHRFLTLSSTHFATKWLGAGQTNEQTNRARQVSSKNERVTSHEQLRALFLKQGIFVVTKKV